MRFCFGSYRLVLPHGRRSQCTVRSDLMCTFYANLLLHIDGEDDQSIYDSAHNALLDTLVSPRNLYCNGCNAYEVVYLKTAQEIWEVAFEEFFVCFVFFGRCSRLLEVKRAR